MLLLQHQPPVCPNCPSTCTPSLSHRSASCWKCPPLLAPWSLSNRPQLHSASGTHPLPLGRHYRLAGLPCTRSHQPPTSMSAPHAAARVSAENQTQASDFPSFGVFSVSQVLREQSPVHPEMLHKPAGAPSPANASPVPCVPATRAVSQPTKCLPAPESSHILFPLPHTLPAIPQLADPTCFFLGSSSDSLV